MISTRGINFILFKKIAKFYNPGVQTVQTANLRAASSNPGDIQYFYHLCSILQFGNFSTPEGTLTLVEVMFPALIAKPGGRPKKGDPAGDPTNAIIRVFAMQKRVMQKEYKTSYCVTSLKEIFGTVDYANSVQMPWPWACFSV